MKWKSYPEYKPSSTEWLGGIPAQWQTKRLKYVSSCNDEALEETTNPDFDLLYVDIGSVDQNAGILTKEPMRFEIAPSRARRRVRHGDVIVSTVRTYLRAIAPIVNPEPNLIVSTGFAVVRPKDGLANTFAAYALRAPYFVDAVVARSGGVSYPAINASDLVALPIVLPSLAEQRAIAAFLDRETARIDALIGKKERQIELLQEKRAALISHAVTKGLDPNVKMKDSGVEWLGNIPAHWETAKLGRIAASLQTGPFGSQLHAADYVEGGVPAINPANLQDGEIVPDPRCAVSEAKFAQLSRHRLVEGDIVFARRGEMGRCARVTKTSEGFLCGTGSLRVRLNTGMANPQYMNLFLGTLGVRDHLLLESVGSTMDNLNTGILARIPVTVPPMKEQAAIVGHVDTQTTRIKAIAETVLQSIATLREYRTALISAAVTGKIDVCGEVA